MLETWNLVRNFTNICSFRKYTFQYQGFLNFVDISIFLAKNQHSFAKNYTFTQSNCVRDFLVLFSLFVRLKVTVNENVAFKDYASRIRLPDCFKSSINRKNNNEVLICRHDVVAKFFDVVLFPLSILITGPSFMSISSLVLELWQFSFIEDWPEIGNRKYHRLSFAQYLETKTS